MLLFYYKLKYVKKFIWENTEIQIILLNKYMEKCTNISILKTHIIVRIRAVRSWTSLSANLFSMFYSIQLFCQRTTKAMISLRGYIDQFVHTSDWFVKWKNNNNKKKKKTKKKKKKQHGNSRLQGRNMFII